MSATASDRAMSQKTKKDEAKEVQQRFKPAPHTRVKYFRANGHSESEKELRLACQQIDPTGDTTCAVHVAAVWMLEGSDLVVVCHGPKAFVMDEAIDAAFATATPMQLRTDKEVFPRENVYLFLLFGTLSLLLMGVIVRFYLN